MELHLFEDLVFQWVSSWSQMLWSGHCILLYAYGSLKKKKKKKKKKETMKEMDKVLHKQKLLAEVPPYTL